ncbi:MAG TPA: cytochrome P450, partial [Streptomyces sp.]
MTITDPDTYTQGVPYDELARLRAASPVVRVDDFWAVLRHADVRRVLRDPGVFSSQLGGTQIRDPATSADLAYVRRMMLNMDPPEHGRLRGLLTKAFTPRAIAKLESQIERWARDLVAAVADQGECDFAKVAADLPLRTLAGVFGVPEQDRRLMYDWSNRVIGYQDAEYAVSSTVSETEVTGLARAALAVRPSPGPDGSMPDPRTRAGMPDLYAYANALGEYKRDHPGDDVMSNLMRHVADDGGRVSLAEFENLFWLFSVAG